MELVFALIDKLRDEMVLKQLRNPSEDRRTEFDYGRLHGMLFMLELLQEQLEVETEAQAQRQQQREREF